MSKIGIEFIISSQIVVNMNNNKHKDDKLVIDYTFLFFHFLNEKSRTLDFGNQAVHQIVIYEQKT